MLVMGVLYRRASSSTDLLLRTECGTLGTITIPSLASIWGESERESGVNVRNAGLSLACRRDHYTVLSHFRGPAGSPPHFLRIEELLAETCISVLREKERRRAADTRPRIIAITKLNCDVIMNIFCLIVIVFPCSGKTAK